MGSDQLEQRLARIEERLSAIERALELTSTAHATVAVPAMSAAPPTTMGDIAGADALVTGPAVLPAGVSTAGVSPAGVSSPSGIGDGHAVPVNRAVAPGSPRPVSPQERLAREGKGSPPSGRTVTEASRTAPPTSVDEAAAVAATIDAADGGSGGVVGEAAPADDAKTLVAPVDVGRPAPPTVSSSRPDGRTGKLTVEQFIGAKIAAWIGAILAVLATAFFLKYAYDNEWLQLLPPALRCLIAAAFGLLLLGAGEIALRRIGHRASAGLSISGLGVLYLTVLAALHLFKLVSEPGAFLLLALVTAIGVAITVRSRGLAVGVLSLLLGYVAPLVIGASGALATLTPMYLTALLAVALTLSAIWRRPFRHLRAVILPVHGIAATIWAAVDPGATPLAVVIFSTVWWAMLQGEALWAALRRQSSIGNVVVSLVATAWFANLALWSMHTASTELQRWTGGFAFGLALATAAIAFTFGEGVSVLRQRPRHAIEKLALAQWVEAGVLLVVAVALQFSGTERTLCWFALGAAAIEIGRRLRAAGLDRFGLVHLALGVVSLLTFDMARLRPFSAWWSTGVVQTGMWHALLLVAAVLFLFSAFRLRSLGTPMRAFNRSGLFGLGLTFLLGALVSYLSGVEITLAWSLMAIALLVLSTRLDREIPIAVAGVIVAFAAAARWLCTDVLLRLSVVSPFGEASTVVLLVSAAVVTMTLAIVAWRLARPLVPGLDGGTGALVPAPGAGAGPGTEALSSSASYRTGDHTDAPPDVRADLSLRDQAGAPAQEVDRGSFDPAEVGQHPSRLVRARAGVIGLVIGLAPIVLLLVSTHLNDAVRAETHAWSLPVMLACAAALAALIRPLAAQAHGAILPDVPERRFAAFVLVVILGGIALLWAVALTVLPDAQPRTDIAPALLWGGVNLVLLTLVIDGGALASLTVPDRLEGRRRYLWFLASAVLLVALGIIGDRALRGADTTAIAAAQLRHCLWVVLGAAYGFVLTLGEVWRRQKAPAFNAIGAAWIMLAGAGWIGVAALAWRVSAGEPAALPVALNPIAISGLVAMIACIAGAVMERRIKRGLPALRPSAERTGGAGGFPVILCLVTLAAAILLILVTLEVERFFLVAREDGTFRFEQSVARPVVSVWWALFGITTVVFGLRRDLPWVRYAGLALLGVTVFKFLVIDMQGVQTLWRVIAMAVVGLLLVATSMVYWRAMAMRHAAGATPGPVTDDGAIRSGRA